MRLNRKEILDRMPAAMEDEYGETIEAKLRQWKIVPSSSPPAWMPCR